MRHDIYERSAFSSTSANGRWERFCVLALLAILGHAVRSDAASWPAQCPTEPGASGGMTGVSDSCNCANVVDCDGDSDVGLVEKGTYNIVVIVGDDQGYCQYGFMHGYCKNTGELCRSNIDCCKADPTTCASDANAVCISNRDPEEGPLRLSDWTCRYRQPPAKRTKSQMCEGVLDHSGDTDGDASAYPFNHSSYPCPHTATETYRKSSLDSYVADPVSMTPNLDRLASNGVVFTRAHVHGNSCKPSRAAMTFGMHHRHMKSASAAPESIAAWVADVGKGHMRILWGKGEVITATQGGYQDGETGNGPATGRYKCKPGSHEAECKQAVDAAETAVARILDDQDPPADIFTDIPPEARRGKNGMDRMFGEVFEQAVGGGTLIESTNVTQEGAGKGACTTLPGTKCNSKWNAPFFLWYAPKQPHKGGAGQSYHDLYDGLGKSARNHFARVSQVDTAAGALEDELRRACVCVKQPGSPPTRKAESLLENTVIFYFADHGFLLPESKRNPSENNHRTVMIISDPRHRDGTLAPRLYEYELASSIDILQTVMDYAKGLDAPPPNFPRLPIVPGGGVKDQRGYQFARDLKPFVNDEKSGLRQVLYGEEASDGIATSDTRPRYLIPRPGNVGICYENGDPVETDEIPFLPGLSFNHVKLCADAGDCGPSRECRKWTGTGADGKRCVNNPGRVCAQSSDCDPSYDPDTQTFNCPSGGKCAFDPQHGSLADFAPDRVQNSWDHGTVPNGGFEARTCAGTNRCVPAVQGDELGLCQPIMLKLEVDGNGANPKAWDLNWDPDQRRDLLDADPDYLGGLKDRLVQCLTDFHALDSNNLWVPPPSSTGCPWPENDPL